MQFDPLLWDDLFKILFAVGVGGLIGLEREFRDKAAGFRTLIFICLGATLFTDYSTKIQFGNNPTVVAAGIVTGVGFLGAGVIMRESGRVIGMTTAATIWLTAAMGMGIGLGQYSLVSAVTVVVLIVLWLFPKFEHWVDHHREERTYEITCTVGYDKAHQLERLIRRCELRMHVHNKVKASEGIVSTLRLAGPAAAHEQFQEELFGDSEVKEFRFY